MALSVVEGAPIRVLLIDGFGNHDWQRTTRLIQGRLANDPRFQVAVSTVPAPAQQSSWRPPIFDCDVVIQTCNDIHGSGQLWPEAVRRDLETFISAGGGMYAFHSANNAFPQWSAYNHMLGLAWRNREVGTAIRIRPDESIERIPPGCGASTNHGERRDRAIHLMGNHPIHVGLPRVWMTPMIEVYTHARGPAEHLSILSWAEDPDSGARWPIEWAVEFGRGRVYTSTFGHVWKDDEDPVNFRCVGFQTLLVRALQWLAHREVDPSVPSPFPTSDSPLLRAEP